MQNPTDNTVMSLPFYGQMPRRFKMRKLWDLNRAKNQERRAKNEKGILCAKLALLCSEQMADNDLRP